MGWPKGMPRKGYKKGSLKADEKPKARRGRPPKAVKLKAVKASKSAQVRSTAAVPVDRDAVARAVLLESAIGNAIRGLTSVSETLGVPEFAVAKRAVAIATSVAEIVYPRPVVATPEEIAAFEAAEDEAALEKARGDESDEDTDEDTDEDEDKSEPPVEVATPDAHALEQIKSLEDADKLIRQRLHNGQP